MPRPHSPPHSLECNFSISLAFCFVLIVQSTCITKQNFTTTPIFNFSWEIPLLSSTKNLQIELIPCWGNFQPLESSRQGR
ncbi:hypothetical protein ABFX02_10G104700 [Erythranthe guttata]